MKKVLFTTLAMALAVVSCNTEKLEPVAGGEGLVTFTAELPGNIATKAYSDGLSATKLSYYVYDEDNSSSNIAALNGTATFDGGLTTTVTLNLVAGKQYSIVFWAQAPEATCYAYDAATKELTVDYASAVAQDENRDAFYVYEPTFKVTGPISKTITLRRPFAQINIGTSDLEAAKAAGLEIKNSAMTVKGVANIINLGDGSVQGNEEVTFVTAAIPAGETFPVNIPGSDPAKPYDYLAMNYVLVGADKSTVDVTLTCDEPSSPMPFTQIPVQRNYRTNIFGALLTDPATFTVEINPGYEVPSYVAPVVATAATTEDMKEVMEQAEPGTPVVVELEDGVTVELVNGVANAKGALEFTFAGDGSQTVDVEAQATDAEGGRLNYQRGSTFTFKNVTIAAGTGVYDGIVCDELIFEKCTITGKLTLYGKATFVDCTFENDMDNQYSIWTWGGTVLNFTNCTFNTNGKAILLYGQPNPSTELTVTKCTFNDRNSGAAGKAAIEVGNDYNATYSIIATDCTVNGFAINESGENTHSTLWANKNSMDADHLSVTIDGVKVK